MSVVPAPSQFLDRLEAFTPDPSSPHPWLDRMVEAAERGVREVAGSKDNPEILKYFALCGHPEIEHDETAWCAAGLGAFLKLSSYPIPPVAHNLMARSYLTYGKPCEPKPGAIMVLPRGAPPFGHVCVITKVNKNGTARVIGCNQSNAITYQTVRIKDALPNGIRWPVAATVKDLRAAGSTEIRDADALENTAVAGATATGAAPVLKELVQASAAPAPDPATVQSAVESAKQVADKLDVLRMLMEAGNAVAQLAYKNPWVVGGILCCLVLFVVARRRKQQRVAKAAMGQPLSHALAG
ncbi:MAG: CHAP domain-containing protein [Bacteroidota bacterium]